MIIKYDTLFVPVGKFFFSLVPFHIEVKAHTVSATEQQSWSCRDSDVLLQDTSPGRILADTGPFPYLLLHPAAITTGLSDTQWQPHFHYQS